jgi:hypothetical protein
MMISRIATGALVLAVSLMAGGCATIVHSGPRAIPIASTPPGAQVSVYDRDNKLVMTNVTPFTAKLSSKYAYFKGPKYRLVFDMPGHYRSEINLTSSVSGWYFGNLLIGGVIGMLIVDPLTGAMYNLAPEKIQQRLSPAQAAVIEDGEGVMVVLLEQTTPAERQQMVRLQ